ncbi:MAG: IS5 family transposase [Candidatus Moraniibacteriota bacterium]
MPKPVKEPTKKSGKKKYKVRNWKEYNEALVNRGRILFQITEEAVKQWEEAERNKKRGRPKKFSDTAIETALTLSQIFRLPLRTTEGLVSDILKKLGAECTAPDYTTLCVRSKGVTVSIQVRDIHENLHLVVDSTGVKVFGEGEWKVRKHGWSKHRTWLKLHLGADEKTGDILVGEVTNNSVHDSVMLDPLLDQLPKEQGIDQCSGDGAYDTRKCYETLKKHRVQKVTIPPQKNAKIWQHGNSKEERLVRDENLRAIRKVGRKKWKEDSDYHRRSLSETAMFRLKAIFGEKVSARSFVNQRVQLLLRLKTLNRMTTLGMPESYVVA